jgi:hypothetical protein
MSPMQQRTRPRNVHRDTITGLPVRTEQASRSPSHSALPRWFGTNRQHGQDPVFKAGSREQLTAIIGITLLLLTGTTFAVTRVIGQSPSSTSHHNVPVQGQSADGGSVLIGTPLPSGYGPMLSDGSTPVVSSPPSDVTGEFCKQSYMFVPNITQWTVPPGCYATIYTPNSANFPARPSWGYCNWWVDEQHLNYPDITAGNFPRSSIPKAGEAVWFNPNVEGASAAGHWAQLVAISPGGYWLLISEMNFGWRGGGYGRVDYRYVHTGPGVFFVEA